MKYTKISFSILFAVFFAYTAVVTSVFAINTSDNENTAAPATQDNGTTATPATQDNGNTGTPAIKDNGNTATPATQDNGTTATPKTGDNGNTAAPITADNGNTAAPATQDNGNTAGGSVTPSTPEPEKNPGSSSGSRGGGSRNRTTPVVATTLPILTAINTSDCPYLNSYMRFGVDNDKTDVTKLQIFLKNSEGLNVDINGIFDQKTLDAVIAFQAKYVEETMAPWGVTTPSGQVFYTTKNKINELVCKTPIKLTAEQLAYIEAYKTGQTDAATTGTTNIDGSVGTSTEVGSADAPLKAAVGTSSIFGKIWGFIKWLFGY